MIVEYPKLFFKEEKKSVNTKVSGSSNVTI